MRVERASHKSHLDVVSKALEEKTQRIFQDASRHNVSDDKFEDLVERIESLSTKCSQLASMHSFVEQLRDKHAEQKTINSEIFTVLQGHREQLNQQGAYLENHAKAKALKKPNHDLMTPIDDSEIKDLHSKFDAMNK